MMIIFIIIFIIMIIIPNIIITIIIIIIMIFIIITTMIFIIIQHQQNGVSEEEEIGGLVWKQHWLRRTTKNKISVYQGTDYGEGTEQKAGQGQGQGHMEHKIAWQGHVMLRLRGREGAVQGRRAMGKEKPMIEISEKLWKFHET